MRTVWFVCLILYIPVNNFSVMSGQVLFGWTSTKQRIKCLAQGHKAVPLAAVKARTRNPSIRSLALYLWALYLTVWNVSPDRDPNCLTVFQKELFKKSILKKVRRWQQKHKKIPSKSEDNNRLYSSLNKLSQVTVPEGR